MHRDKLSVNLYDELAGTIRRMSQDEHRPSSHIVAEAIAYWLRRTKKNIGGDYRARYARKFRDWRRRTP